MDGFEDVQEEDTIIALQYLIANMIGRKVYLRGLVKNEHAWHRAAVLGEPLLQAQE